MVWSPGPCDLRRPLRVVRCERRRRLGHGGPGGCARIDGAAAAPGRFGVHRQLRPGMHPRAQRRLPDLRASRLAPGEPAPSRAPWRSRMILALFQTHIAAVLLAFTPPAAHSLSDTLPPWRDPSPHRVVHLQISTAVQLEVLDWGGEGKPLIFLAGGGEAGHVYDGFAPRFTSRYHVIAITRRGVGASSHPSAGYDTTTLVRDIVAALDSLG